MSDFDVQARLELSTRGSQGALRALSDRLGRIGAMVRGTGGPLQGLVSNVFALGAGYVGVNALATGFTSLVRGAAQFESEMQSTQIGLASIMRAVEGIQFSEAQALASGVFNELTEAAIQSTATTQELFGIYAGIYGPIRAAGFAMSDVLHLTSQTASAAAALGIDLPQATRDISAMARGSAGLDVRLFSALRSMGSITESAQEFNQLTQAERIQRLQRALEGFDEAGEAYSRSLPGLTSTFVDIVQQLRRQAFAPIFATIQRALGSINDRLLASRQRLGAALEQIGTRVARILESYLDPAIGWLDYVASHWDEIAARIQSVVAQVRAMIPHLVRAAAIWSAISVARQVVGGGLQAAGAIGSVAGGLGSLAGIGGGTGLVGEGAGAAGALGIEGVLAALSTALAPLALIFVALAGVATFVATSWDQLLAIMEPLMPIVDSMGADFMAIGSALWDILRPILRIVGANIFVMLVPALLTLLVALRLLVRVVRWVVEAVAWAMGYLETYVINPVIDFILELVRRVTEVLGGVMGAVGLAADDAEDDGGALGGDAPDPPRESSEAMPTLTGPPQGAQHITNDFRGSRISVRQDFRDEDPDRVIDAMSADIQRFAEQRVSSGFVPALAR